MRPGMSMRRPRPGPEAAADPEGLGVAPCVATDSTATSPTATRPRELSIGAMHGGARPWMVRKPRIWRRSGRWSQVWWSVWGSAWFEV